MPQSLRKSFTAWLQFPALPPTPSMNSRPPRSRSTLSSTASASILENSILLQIAPDRAKNSATWPDACFCSGKDFPRSISMMKRTTQDKRVGTKIRRVPDRMPGPEDGSPTWMASATSRHRGRTQKMKFPQATAVRVTEVHRADMETPDLGRVRRRPPYRPQSRRKLFVPASQAGPRYDHDPPDPRTMRNFRRRRPRSPAPCLRARTPGAYPV